MESFKEMNRWLQILLLVGAVAVVAEAADGFRIENPAAAWIFAAVHAAALAWTAWGRAGGRIAGPIVVALLAAMEFMGVAFTYERPTTDVERVIYVVFAILSVVLIVLAIGSLFAGLKKGKRNPPAA